MRVIAGVLAILYGAGSATMLVLYALGFLDVMQRSAVSADQNLALRAAIFAGVMLWGCLAILGAVLIWRAPWSRSWRYRGASIILLFVGACSLAAMLLREAIFVGAMLSGCLAICGVALLFRAPWSLRWMRRVASTLLLFVVAYSLAMMLYDASAQPPTLLGDASVLLLAVLRLLGAVIPLFLVWASTRISLPQPHEAEHHVGSDVPFYIGLWTLSGVYVFLIVACLSADAIYPALVADSENSSWVLVTQLVDQLRKPEIHYSIRLSLVSCTLTTILSMLVAVPIGYVMSRYRFRGREFLDALMDIPIVLPPLVIGLSLLVLFSLPVSSETLPNGNQISVTINDLLEKKLGFGVTFTVGAIVLSQFMVAAAFAVRTMRVTFDQISPRHEQVALTLGCTRAQAFWRVVLPETKHGLLTAATLAWARSLGEFGPILIFAGTTRRKTEVMSSSVFLEISTGNIEGALAVSFLMVVAAVFVLVTVRIWGNRDSMRGAR